MTVTEMVGGSQFILRNNIPYIKRDDLLQDALELLCIEIRKPKSKTLLVWPPSSKIELFKSFENFLEQIDDENKDIVITGNPKCNLIEQGRSQATLKLQDIMDIFKLRQHIQSPTRTNVKTSSLIDVILTRIDNGKITNAGVIDLGISDHSLVYVCKVSIPKEPPKIVCTRQFKNYQINNFKQDLANCINSH